MAGNKNCDFWVFLFSGVDNGSGCVVLSSHEANTRLTKCEANRKKESNMAKTRGIYHEIEAKGYLLEFYANGLEVSLWLNGVRLKFHWLLTNEAWATLKAEVNKNGTGWRAHYAAQIGAFGFKTKNDLKKGLRSLSDYAVVAYSKETAPNNFQYATKPIALKEQLVAVNKALAGHEEREPVVKIRVTPTEIEVKS